MPLPARLPPVIPLLSQSCKSRSGTAHLRINILDFTGFDSSIILIVQGGIPGSIGNSPDARTHGRTEAQRHGRADGSTDGEGGGERLMCR